MTAIINENTGLLLKMAGRPHSIYQETPVRWTQYLTGFISALGSFCFGAAFGWSSPGLLMLVQDNDILKIEKHEGDWVASIINIGCIISNLTIGGLMSKFGSKKAMLLLCFPLILGWLLIIYANHIVTMMAGRLLLGVGGAFFLACPQYCTEIADKGIRGTLGTFVQLNFMAGILFAYIVGAYTNIYWFSVICGVLPIIFGILFFCMPNSPHYLITQDKEGEAIDALRWLRGHKYDFIKEAEEIKADIKNMQSENLPLNKALGRRAVRRGLVVSIGLVFFLQFSGINVVLFFMKEIFEDAGVGLSSDISSIVMGVVQVLATAFCGVIIDKCGRKILLILSSSIMTVCLIMLGLFYYLKDMNHEYVPQLSWVPLTSLSIYTVAFSIGLGPVPWLIISEVFSHDVKAVCGSLTGTIGWILSFIITSNFNKLPIGRGPIFWIFGAITGLGALFEIIFVPETKGKTLSDIQIHLSRR